MGVFEMVTIIVTVSVFGGIVTKYLETRKGLGGEAGKRLQQVEAEQESLKKRIRNLETMVALDVPSKPLELDDEVISFDDKLENQLSKTRKRAR